MQTICKPFNTLTTAELYAILQLRSQVFVVEQNCVYQDLDNKDFDAQHLLFITDKTVVAYCRIFLQADVNICSIGRVVVHQDYRKQQLGKKLMQKALAIIGQHRPSHKISLSAQQYLTKFYQDLGFKVVGNGYLEDGIPHIKMVK